MMARALTALLLSLLTSFSWAAIGDDSYVLPPGEPTLTAGADLQSPYLIVSTTGANDPACGTLQSPCKDPEYAVQQRTSGLVGPTIYIRAGTYGDHDGDGGVILMGQGQAPSGTSGNLVTVRNFPGEQPIFTSPNTPDGIKLYGQDYWRIEGIRFQTPIADNPNGGSSCITLSGDNEGRAVQNVEIVSNEFSGCGYTAINCTQGNGHTAIYSDRRAFNILIDSNYFENSGRNLDTSPCSIPGQPEDHRYRHDHHVYLQGKYHMVVNNVFVDAHSGFPVKISGWEKALYPAANPGEFTHIVVNNTFGPKTNPNPYEPLSGGPVRPFTNTPADEHLIRWFFANNLILDQEDQDSAIVISNNFYINELNLTGNVCYNNIQVESSITPPDSMCAEHLAGFAGYSTSTNDLVEQTLSSLALYDSANRDYRIYGSSIAVDYGITTNAPSDDKDGFPRVGNPDVGAYEN